MKLPLSFWAKRFMLQAVVWIFGVIAIVVVGGGIGHPLMMRLFADGWQWMPFDKWLMYVLFSIPGGLFAGSLFTYGEWLQHDSSTLKQRIIVLSLILLVVVYPCLFIAPRMIKSMVAALL